MSAGEVDNLMPRGTWRRYMQDFTAGMIYWRAYWGRRIMGGAMSLVADALSEMTDQVMFSSMPGHPQQWLDSAEEQARERGYIRFSNESLATLGPRLRAAWSAYAQAGTPQQIIRAVNEWGRAGWPDTWADLTSANLVESGVPTDFSATLTIPYGIIFPPLDLKVYGVGLVYGDPSLFYGVGPSSQIPVLLWLVRKWKRASSIVYVKVYYAPASFVTFTVG